ncbi:MAG TPA: MBL fold metallo-hydrolase [Phycisphaerae bacterium]|nr:MBL fold metallo-hydrolase [Phycisphaerae bacterium]
MELIIISIGALSKNPLWNERIPVRTSHSTTTLIRTTAAKSTTPVNLLVDPSLPAQALEARLYERSGLKAEDITHIFLTNWRPVHRRGLEHFPKATWWMNPTEIEAAAAALDAAEENARRHEGGGQRPDDLIAKERALLAKVQPAPDDLAEGIDLYPLPGYTPGQSGLLVSEPTRTTIIAGDAVPTAAHFLAGQVFPDCYDLERAKDSLAEMYEVADLIVPGHDNIFLTPRVGG